MAKDLKDDPISLVKAAWGYTKHSPTMQRSFFISMAVTAFIMPILLILARAKSDLWLGTMVLATLGFLSAGEIVTDYHLKKELRDAFDGYREQVITGTKLTLRVSTVLALLVSASLILIIGGA